MTDPKINSILDEAIFQGIHCKVKAKTSKLFENLSNNTRFQNLIS